MGAKRNYNEVSWQSNQNQRCYFIIPSWGNICRTYLCCFSILHYAAQKRSVNKNIVIILSSWAVIKFPMLLNEVKFLGVKFMAVRWILTVIAIVIFSWIASKIVKRRGSTTRTTFEPEGVIINRNACMGCSLCVKNYPELFEISSKTTVIKYDFPIDEIKLKKAIDNCPVKAIQFNKR